MWAIFIINVINNNKIKIKHRKDLSGVYKINCEEFDEVHIGKTGRKFIKRVNEHKSSLKKRDDKLLFGKHANDACLENVNLKWKFGILRIKNDTQKRKLLEQLEIIKQKGRNNHCNWIWKWKTTKIINNK